MTFVRIARAMPGILALSISVQFLATSALAESWEEGIVLSEEDPAGLGESVLMPGNGANVALPEQTAPFDSEMMQQSI